VRHWKSIEREALEVSVLVIRSHTTLSVRGTYAFARYIGVEPSMMLRRVRTTKSTQGRPQRSRLGGLGILGYPMDDGFVCGVGWF